LLFERFIKTVSNIFDAHTAVLLAPVKKKENEPLTVLSWHSRSNNCNPYAKIHKGEGLIGWVYKEKKPLHFNHFEKDPQLLTIYEGNLQIKAIMIVCIPENMGVLLVDSKNRYAFPEKSIKILGDFADLAYDLLISLEQKSELYFLRRYKELILSNNNDFNTLILNLINMTGLEKAMLASSKSGDKKFKILIQYNLPEHINFFNETFYLRDGLIGWVFNNKKSIFLSINQNNSSKTHILYEKDKLPCYNYFLGIYLKKDNYSLCLSMFGNKKKSGTTFGNISLLEKTLNLIITDNFHTGDL